MGKQELAVEAFIAVLDHPLKDEILMLRHQLLAVDPAIGEKIRWKAPSFHTREHFATMQLRRPGVLRLILHRGAKAPPVPAAAIDGPQGLLSWPGPDRAPGIPQRHRAGRAPAGTGADHPAVAVPPLGAPAGVAQYTSRR